MASLTFDTLKFAEKLEKAGVTRYQATVTVEAQKNTFAKRGFSIDI